MAVTITVQDVKDTITSTLSDPVIQRYIDSMETKVGVCIDAYDDDTAFLIKTNLVAYQIAVNEDIQDVVSKKAPNGASITYSSPSNPQTGIMSNKYGRTVYNLDVNLCWKGFIKSNIAFKAVGQSNRCRLKGIR